MAILLGATFGKMEADPSVEGRTNDVGDCSPAEIERGPVTRLWSVSRPPAVARGHQPEKYTLKL